MQVGEKTNCAEKNTNGGAIPIRRTPATQGCSKLQIPCASTGDQV